jgi:RNA polymerase sigma-70 factor, ECF subfamily
LTPVGDGFSMPSNLRARLASTGQGGEAAGGAERQKVVYCVVPRDLAARLHDLLRNHWKHDAGVRVVVEQRRSDRRVADRRADSVVAPLSDRRTVMNVHGRRVADRRAITLGVDAPPLPRRARPFVDRLVFLERLEPTKQALLDVESSRLIIQIQAGDENAMAELYLLYFEPIYAYTRLALRDAHEAEDVTQQVFVKAMQAIPALELRATVSFRAWLFRIARNALVDTVRKRARLALEAPDRIGRRRELVDMSETSTVLSWLTDGDLTLFIERLPMSQREVLVLRYMLDLEIDDIASVVGRTPKAVRRLHERALVTLEDRLLAIGRRPLRGRRAPMRVRLRPAPVMAARRFALMEPLRPPQLGRSYFRAWGG